jgi:hypothetical protein
MATAENNQLGAIGLERSSRRFDVTLTGGTALVP